MKISKYKTLNKEELSLIALIVHLNINFLSGISAVIQTIYTVTLKLHSPASRVGIRSPCEGPSVRVPGLVPLFIVHRANAVDL